MFRLVFSTVVASCLAVLPAFAEDDAPAVEKRRQLVVVSFDGAHDNLLWEKSRAMARNTGATFTYFLSCTFLFTRDERMAYQAPHEKPGRSNVGFGQTKEEVILRLGEIWLARLEGHEIGSHACGHFDGGAWSAADWKREFAFFREALRDGWKTAGVAEREPADWKTFAEEEIIGFRAPYLSVGPGLTEALKETGFRYDASLVSKGPAMPVSADGLVRFALPLVPEGDAGRPVIAMDYNLFVRHSRGIENSRDSALFEARTLDAFHAAFRQQYEGERIPLQLGFHFVEMNGGAYWRALERFLEEVCGEPDVGCVSHREALDIIAKEKKAAGTAF